MTHRYAKRLARIGANAAKTQGEDFLDNDVTLKYADSTVRVSVAINSAVKLEWSPSSGSPFYLNGGAALTADTVYTELVQLDTERTWNIQTDDAGGTTVLHLIITEIEGGGT